jgi:hypothetical protein
MVLRTVCFYADWYALLLMIELESFVGHVDCEDFLSAAADIKFAGLQLVFIQVSRFDSAFTCQTLNLNEKMLTLNKKVDKLTILGFVFKTHSLDIAHKRYEISFEFCLEIIDF